MAYTKQTWTCGDTITADKLNHMEDGIAEGGGGSETLVVTMTGSLATIATLDKTWQEIADAMPNVLINKGSVTRVPVIVGSEEDNYYVGTFNSDGIVIVFNTNSNTGYPRATN